MGNLTSHGGCSACSLLPDGTQQVELSLKTLPVAQRGFLQGADGPIIHQYFAPKCIIDQENALSTALEENLIRLC